MAHRKLNNSVIVGRVADAYGVRGHIKVRSFTDQPENLLDFQRWELSKKSGECQLYLVFSSQIHGKFVTAKLEGVDTRDQALELKGSDIQIPIGDFPNLPEGDYYHFQLLGLKAIDIDGTVYGQVDRVMQTGANDVLVVEGENSCLIPYIPDVIKTVDLETGVIRVEWQIEI